MRSVGLRQGFLVGLFAILQLAAMVSGALAGSVSFVTLNYSADRFVPQFHFDGPVVEGDSAALADMIDAIVECDKASLGPQGGNCAVVTLNSPGGSYVEGLRLAALMRDRSIATVVEENAKCYSACAFAFLGGTGYSSQEGIGAYIDRMIEPGGILGFHAPYFAPESLDGLVAEFGLGEVLGASRDDISLMIQQLVDWNVNPNALSHIVRMGPSETYDIVSGGDYTKLWAQLPPAPVFYWNANQTEALRNACINLLAYHQNILPDAAVDQVPLTLETGLANDEKGQSLTGFRLGQDNPLDVSYCALPEGQADMKGDIDLSLYTGPGVKGAARPVVSLFNRLNGWSSMGTGDNPTRRDFQKGSMNHLFVDILTPVKSNFITFMSYLDMRKFRRFNDLALPSGRVDFPTSSLQMTALGKNQNIELMEYRQHQIITEAGSDLLYATGELDLKNRPDLEINFTSKSEHGFAVGGSYRSGRPFLWMGLKGDNGATALVRIESLDMPEDLPTAIAEQRMIACTFKLHGNALKCR